MIRLFYLTLVFFLLFFALGQRAFSGSEDRWGEIARNMLLYGDLFHPIINGEVYFDKPLISYWLIVLSSYWTNGLSELAVRLPGALSALLTLFCGYKLAAELFDRRVAWLSICLIITSYGFLFWSHTASAELSNLALITAAVAWFVHRKDRTDFPSYLAFYLLCAVGSQLKGLTAVVVPILVILPYLLRRNRWKLHINVSHLIALILSIGVFFLPYLGASLQPLPAGIESQHNNLSGLDLLVRENIVRFFEPFDHVDPFYSYLYAVPRILFPWMFIFIAALCYYCPRYRKLNESHRWLLEMIAIVFLFFTFSGSRRWYYILPIMPFCMILISAYMLEAGEQKWRRIAMSSTLILLAVAGALLLLFPVAVKAYAGGHGIPSDFLIGSAVVAAAAIGTMLLGRRCLAISRQVLRLDIVLPALMPFFLLVAALEMIVVFGFVLPGTDSYRQLKPFAFSLSTQLNTDEKLVFYKKANTALAFYLNSKHPIPVIESGSELSASKGRVIVVLEKSDENRLFSEFPSLRSAEPVAMERTTSRTTPKKLISSSTNFVAYRLP